MSTGTLAGPEVEERTTIERPIPVTPVEPRAPRRRTVTLVVVVGLLLALVAGVMIWLAVASTGFTRGQLADIARLEGQAELYEQQALERGREADIARWVAQAERHEQVRQARVNEAATARLEGLADEYLGR
jgi:ABC-type lipoprotein release transport system permease subunit